MKPSLGIIVLVWFGLHLGQAAVGHNPVSGQEAYIYNGLPSHKSPEDELCTLEIMLKEKECVKKIRLLLINGFPWAMHNMRGTQNQIRNQHKQRSTLRDPLDPINYVCQAFGDFCGCLGPIPRECWLSSNGGIVFRVHTFLTFICHIRPRSIDLLHSLQCLKESRVLDLLVFYLANNPGTHIDDMAQGTVNALFKLLNSSELILKYSGNALAVSSDLVFGYVCLPESVITHDISFIINRKCGADAAGPGRRPGSRLLPLLSYRFKQCIKHDRFPRQYL